MYKIACLLSTLIVCASIHGATVAERGGGAHGSDVHSGYQGGEIQHQNRPYGYEGGYYGGYGGYEGGVVAPVYPGGGYLLPGPVDPGQDEADAIYRANQHPGE
jgi:hypothetical protein